MAGRGMGAATQGGGCVTKGPKNRMIKATSKTTGPILMQGGGDVNVYEILGRRVTKKEYEDASRRMDEPQSETERDLDNFGKRARERARKMGEEMGRPSKYETDTLNSLMKKKKGGMVNAHKKMAMGKKKK